MTNPLDDAFPDLTTAQLERLEAYGHVEQLATDAFLIREGEVYTHFDVILDGQVDVLRHDTVSREDTVIASHGAGRFLGELGLLTGQRAFLRLRTSRPTTLRRLNLDEFRQLSVSDPDIGDLAFSAFVARRELLKGKAAASSLRVVGSRFSKLVLELRSWLRHQRIAHTWIDLDSEEVREVRDFLNALGIGPADTPVVITSTAVLRTPTVGELAEHLGLTYQPSEGRVYDLVVVGAGPAGLASAVYGASEGLDTLLLDRVGVGGQAGASSRIENYVGFPTGISGGDLVERAALQAQRLGAHINSPCEVVAVHPVCEGYRLTLTDGAEIITRSVIAALGVQYRKLPIDGMERFEGNGVYYAATDLEARVCGTGPVTVVGGGNSAGQAALYLAREAQVTIAIRGDDLTKSMSAYLIDRIEQSPNITVDVHSEVVALHGGKHLESITVRSNASGDSTDRECVGVFCFVGAVPFTDWLGDFVALDARGFVLTDSDVVRGPAFSPLPYETSRPGFFAVGDVRARSTKRVAAAVGEGSSAVRSVHERLAVGG